ncbi:kinase-like protein, partial [Pleomassaria siparia CBS 279.74]
FDTGKVVDGRWEIVRNLASSQEISHGSMNGGINLVKDLNNGGALAIQKLLPPKWMKQCDSGVAKLEVGILGRLNHPNIVALKGFNLPEHLHDVPYMCMEYCDRGTLQHLLSFHNNEDLGIPEAFVWHVLESLTSAILQCHQGPKKSTEEPWDPIFHRDIILANVFMTSTRGENAYPVIKLGDFGCSIPQSDMTSGSVLEKDLPPEDGSWIAPEGPVPTKPADIFQIGLIAYCLLTGVEEPYYRNYGIGRSMIWYFHEETRWSNMYSKELLKIIVQCVVKIPDKRPSAAELLDMIRKAK